MHHMHQRKEKQNRALDEIERSGYSDGAYKNEPEGCGLVPALSVQMWMNCSHLLPIARTRWVTERIASAQAIVRRLASGIKRRNDGFGCRTHDGRLGQKRANLIFIRGKKKLGTKAFLLVDFRPNG